VTRFAAGVPTAAVDVVGVFDDAFNQVFERARPIKAMIKESAKPMEHPVESGSTITDHRIINPVEITLFVILAADDYRSVYEQIKAYFLKSILLTVQTRTGIYKNQFVMEMPHDEDPEMFDTVALSIKTKEVLLVDAQAGRMTVGTVRNPANASTADRGEQQGGNTGSILSQVFR
jgi:hypothetical protein